MATLLAVDLGLKTGLALYGEDGRLRWYRSRNYGTAARLRRAIPQILRSGEELSCLVLEGGGPLARPWEQAAERRDLRQVTIAAETWRRELLYPRQQRGRLKAKHSAEELARRVIEWSGLHRAPGLRHDTAEAVLIGLWGVLHFGWLDQLPSELHP